VDDNRAVTLQIWDTTGQEQFQGLGVAFCQRLHELYVLEDLCLQKI